MNRKTAQSLLAVALVCAAVLPAAADEGDEDEIEIPGFLCLIDPTFSQTLTGDEDGTYDSKLTCEQEDGVLEMELECETVLDRTTVKRLIGTRKSKTFRDVPCRIDANRCDGSLEPQQPADESKLIVRKTGRTTLECELEVPFPL